MLHSELSRAAASSGEGFKDRALIVAGRAGPIRVALLMGWRQSHKCGGK